MRVSCWSQTSPIWVEEILHGAQWYCYVKNLVGRIWVALHELTLCPIKGAHGLLMNLQIAKGSYIALKLSPSKRKGHILWDPLKLVGAESDGTHVRDPTYYPHFVANMWPTCPPYKCKGQILRDSLTLVGAESSGTLNPESTPLVADIQPSNCFWWATIGSVCRPSKWHDMRRTGGSMVASAHHQAKGGPVTFVTIFKVKSSHHLSDAC